jgi:F-type H+-transporting ATPase subunit b
MNINLTLFAQALVFIAFIWVSKRFVWSWLMTKIEERQKLVADGLAAGERGTQDLEHAGKRAAEELHKARDRAMEIIAQADKRAVQIVDEAKGAAKTEGDRLVAGARAEIEQEVFRAKESLRQQVADLAVSGAAKILGREVNAQVHADLLTRLKQEL